MNSDFVHLHNHTEYSALDGFGSVEAYVERAGELGQTHLAITDHGTVAGALKFQRECEKQGVVPIIGSELYVVPDASKRVKEKPGHITILVMNRIGWTELCRMITYSNLHGFYKKPRIDFETLLGSDMSGWIVMTACLGSFLRLKGGLKCLRELHERNFDRLYFEIMPHKERIQKDYNEFVLNLYHEYRERIPLVATNDCHYVKRGDWKAQECLLAIQRAAKWNDPNRWRFEIKGLHLRSKKEMVNAFERQGQFTSKQIQQAMRNTAEIAGRCENFRIPKQDISLPEAPGTEGGGANQILYDMCDSRGQALPQWNDEYAERFLKEFDLIKKKKFAQYFLIFHDIIRHCNENDIEYGPGRGSTCGSLIAYLLGITKIDPIKFDLSFARFISEDRIDYPDIDVDFQHSKRDGVVEYIESVYGKNNVCGISTDTRMKSKGVLWDVGRVFDIPRKDVSAIANSVNSKDREKTLQAHFDESSTGQWFSEKHPEASELAIKLENQLRHFGQHPAAVVICADDLTSGKYGSLRLQLQKGRKENHIVSSWDMEDSEYNGLIKFDILSLSTLSVLSECRKLINESQEERPSFWYHAESECHFVDHNHNMEEHILEIVNVDFNFDKISLDDSRVFEALSEGNTSGVFQFSERPTTEFCKDMGVDSFEDMIAVSALVRPGPYQSGMAANYIKRKHGEKWKPLHPIYEKITENTYGLIVYQEQVMRVISQVAGMSGGAADKIRKVIGKKRDSKEFEPYRIRFFEGCKKQKTLSRKEAEAFWEGLKEHAGYSFNLAHATAYSLLGYQTAFAKIHYPAEFICACLTHSKKDEKQDLIDDAQELGLKVMLPKVDISDASKWTVKNGVLYAPFTEIGTMGPAQAGKYCKTAIEENVGFFNIRTKPDDKLQAVKLLKEIGAYDPDREPDDKMVEKHFSFILSDESYPELVDLIGYVDLTLEKPIPGLIKPTRRFQNIGLLECDNCELRRECRSPVLPSPGIFNMFIVGEAPGFQEDRYGRGFHEDAPAGGLLWSELALYGLERRVFHVTNINKCFPGKRIKTPNANHINACAPWLAEEFSRLKPKLVLACGNTAVKAFTNRDGGIMNLSGTTEWIPSISAWACWCVHPAAILRRDGNREYFERGIRNFAEKLEMLK